MRTQLASVATAILLAASSLALSPGSLMAATIVTIPPFTEPAGDSFLPPRPSGANLASGFTQYLIQVDTTAYQPTDTITIFVWFAHQDGSLWPGGLTWWGGCGLTTTGGTHTDRLGNVSNFAACGSQFPGGVSTGLKADVEVNVPSAGTLSGQVTLS